jgi:uncharacterized protein HemY
MTGGAMQRMTDALVAGDHATAMRTAEDLAARPGQTPAIVLLIDAALAAGAIGAARTALSEAESRAELPAWHLACLKARIAIHTGDLMAARAILVMALEQNPDHAALRALLTEAMVASGLASDARAVLGHVGKPPANPATDQEEDRPPETGTS